MKVFRGNTRARQRSLPQVAPALDRICGLTSFQHAANTRAVQHGRGYNVACVLRYFDVTYVHLKVSNNFIYDLSGSALSHRTRWYYFIQFKDWS